MDTVLSTIGLTVLLGLLAAGSAFSILWAFHSAGEGNDRLLSRSISDLLNNPPLRLRKALVFAFLLMAVASALIAYDTLRDGHVDRYSRSSNPGPFWLYIGYWIALGIASLLIYFRRSRKLSQFPDRS